MRRSCFPILRPVGRPLGHWPEMGFALDWRSRASNIHTVLNLLSAARSQTQYGHAIDEFTGSYCSSLVALAETSVSDSGRRWFVRLAGCPCTDFVQTTLFC